MTDERLEATGEQKPAADPAPGGVAVAASPSLPELPTNSLRGATIGQYATLHVHGADRLCHFEREGDGKFVVTIYVDTTRPMPLAAQYWRGESYQSLSAALALAVEVGSRALEAGQ